MIGRPPSTGRFAPRLVRALLPPDDPRDDVPNGNDPVGTVGPDVPAGFGDTHVMYPAVAPPAQAEAWAGWPLEWATPYMETTPTWSTFFGYGQSDPAGYWTRVSTVGTCVDKNARQLASFPAYSVTAGIPGELPEWYQWSPEPGTYADWVEFMKAAVNSYLFHGETVLYSLVRYADGFPRRFVVIQPDRVHDDDAGRWWIDVGGHGDRMEVDRDDLCLIRYQPDPDTGRGIGPLAWAARNLVSAAALDTYAFNIATHGVSAVLTAPGELTAAQSAQARADWASARRANPGVPAVLSGGLTYSPLSLSPRDMALLDLKVFDLQMIASAFGVPPGLVGLPQAGGGLEYSSVDMLADHHWRDALRPMAQSFAGALSNWLLPRGTRIEFNPDRYVQPGLGERAQAWAVLHGIVDEHGRRAATVPEIRTFERFAPWSVADTDAPSTSSLVGSPRG